MAGSFDPRNRAATEPIEGCVPKWGSILLRWAKGLPACIGAGKWSMLAWQSTDRTSARRSRMVAWSGKYSEMRTPGTLVHVEPNGPRTSLGAAGFGSHVSSWLGPPDNQIRITALRSARP